MEITSKKFVIALFTILILNFILVDINVVLSNAAFGLLLLVLFFEYFASRFKKNNSEELGIEIFRYKNRFKLQEYILSIINLFLFFSIVIISMYKNTKSIYGWGPITFGDFIANISFGNIASIIVILIYLAILIMDSIWEKKVGKVFYTNGIQLSNGKFITYDKVKGYKKQGYSYIKSYEQEFVKFNIKIKGFFGKVTVIQEVDKSDNFENILKSNI